MKTQSINLNKLKDDRAEKILNALSKKPGEDNVKKGVDLVGLVSNLTKIHLEKIKNSTEEK